VSVCTGCGKPVVGGHRGPHLRDPRDRAIIDAVVEARLAGPGCDVAGLAGGLAPEASAVSRRSDDEEPLMEAVRRMARSGLRGVDALYRLRHRLQPVGPLLLVGRDGYDGAARRFPDGTELQSADLIGTLHFDNARIAALDAKTPNAIGLSFARLLVESLGNLAELARAGGPYGDVAVFRGIGWMRQGAHLGFVSEPFPEGRRKRFLAVHIGLLVWAFAPTGGTAIVARPEPRLIWMTRDTLLERYANHRKHEQRAAYATAGARAG